MFSGKIETMPPIYKTDNQKHIVIRPLAYCKEADIEQYSIEKNFPIIPCNLCGSQDNMQRQNIKTMLQDWELKHPGRTEVIFNSLKNISPSHMLDRNLFNFNDL
jgi:tRNA 2-thiocytidine biosynthesis protein TtcA